MNINTFKITENNWFKGYVDNITNDNKDFESFAPELAAFTKQEAYKYDDSTVFNINQDQDDVKNTEKINVDKKTADYSSSLIKQEELDIKDESVDELCIFNYNECAQNSIVETTSVNRFFSCTFCNFKCSQKSRLINHQKMHPEKKPFICSLCNYKCTQSALLTRHMIIHIGENPRFGNSAHSEKIVNTEHMHVHRGEEKLFHCTHCNYKSKTRSYLITHVRTHTGEKPYVCDYCPCRMAARSNLIVHMKNVHRRKRL